MSDTSHLELSVTRFIDAPPETVYRAYVERTADWWAPKPYTTKIEAMDLRPGGRFAFEMQGPEGFLHPMEALFLEVVPNERIVSTNVFTAGWQPKTLMTTDCDFASVAIVTFEPEGEGTRYTARVRHFDEAAVKAHEAMGFNEGWGIVAGQLAEIAEAEARTPVAA